MQANSDRAVDQPSGAVRLDDWGVIRVRGADAAAFLHGQLTQDMATLGPGQARLAGYCSAKGRLQATFVAWRGGPDDGDILLACSADLLADTVKRLSMFVLRAKAALADASADWPLHGVTGPAVPDMPAWTTRHEGERTWVRLADVDGVARALCAGAPPADLLALGLARWRGLEARSGIARITAATREQFVPQMVNMDLTGGLNFGKGCYPGQEVVARSQYRGTVKRRGFVVSSAAPLQPGQEVFDADAPGDPAGMVVLAGEADQGHVAFIELKLAAAGHRLTAGSADGPALQVSDLPYPLPVEAA